MVNDSTREYSVYLSDTDTGISGSGILFYPGGESLFVFTCAHVVDSPQSCKVSILKTVDAARDLYQVYETEVPASQVYYSPLDVVTEENGERTHTEDLAIIRIAKPEEMLINPTEFMISETSRNHSVFVQGYPNGVPKGRHPIEYLECLHGYVVVNPADSTQFTIRMDDPAIDSGSRVYELEGISGAPVWEDNGEANLLLGLLTSAYGFTAQLSKVRATKAQLLRSLMRERFGIVIERKLEGIPEEEIAGRGAAPIIFSGEIPQGGKTDVEEWIEEQLKGLRLIIEDLKLQKAINRGKELVADPRFAYLSKSSQRRVKQHLLYCYEIADLDTDFEALEEDMRMSGLIKEHDTLRQFSRTFMRRQFQNTIEAAQHCIDTWCGESRDALLSFAKTFLLLSKAYTEDLPVEATIGQLLDDQENYILPTDEIDDEALAYQMIGYVYGEHYHDPVNSVRFLNRSYQIGYDSMVLESLGAAYYKLAIYDATDENGQIPDRRRIDYKALYKARECFLIVKDKADDLFWSGTIRRMGLCVYNTFFFLQDNYRILTLYGDIKKYLPELTEDEWRDVEMKYAKISARKGEIDVSEFAHITAEDGILLNVIARSSRCANLIEDVTANIPEDQIKGLSDFEQEISDTLCFLEDAVLQVNQPERVPIYVQMINLYGHGMLMFGWDKREELRRLYASLSGCGDPDLLEAMENFIFETEAPIEEAIERFSASFEKHKNLVFWQELNHLYIRHGMLERADMMYKELLSARKELIEEGPEYAYRAFIDYVTLYKRDLRYAIQCYLDAKEAFQDTDIQGFLELELMLFSNTFNEPERFELERQRFVKEGLVADESYHRAAFLAYLANLNERKAGEHFEYIRQYPHAIDPDTRRSITGQDEILFLNWIGAIRPEFIPAADSMTARYAAEVRNSYEKETWHRTIDKKLLNQFGLEKTIAMDAWSLSQLAEMDMLDTLQRLERVYVSHLTVLRLLEELSRTNNLRTRMVLRYIQTCDKIQICSAGFRSQMEVRNVARYTEPASAVSVAIEKKCLMIYGEPTADEQLIEHFASRIIRINQIESLIDKEKKQ